MAEFRDYARTDSQGDPIAKLEKRVKDLEKLLRGEDSARKIDPIKALDRAKLVQMMAREEIDPASYPTGGIPQSALTLGESYMRDQGEHCFLYTGAAVNILNGAVGQITLPNISYDISASGQTIKSGNTMVIRRKGIYTIGFMGQASAAGGFGSEWRPRVNGVSLLPGVSNHLGPFVVPGAVQSRQLFLGDVVDLAVLNATGGAANYNAFLYIDRVGDADNNPD